jgi:glycerol-3-phosphate acyltransferase PlsY
VARGTGTDIRRQGSGNIGATNVLRTLGWGAAILTLLLDVVKGWLGTWLGRQAGPDPGWAAAAALLVVVGNCWPVFLRFQGGKGVATGLGAFLGLAPWAVLPGAVVWVALAVSFRYISLASLCAVAGLPLAILALGYPWSAVAGGAVTSVIVVWRHHGNIGRLLAGTERRFGHREPPGSASVEGDAAPS